MRKINYTLADGTQTTSLAKAQASGREFTSSLVEVEKPGIELSEKRKALRVKIS